jgi:tetratricopeptide (TPR) repeat protein
MGSSPGRSLVAQACPVCPNARSERTKAVPLKRLRITPQRTILYFVTSPLRFLSHLLCARSKPRVAQAVALIASVACAFFAFPLIAIAQTAPQTKPPDYSAEPYVVEQFRTDVVFHGDGSYRSESTARIRIQSEDALKLWGTFAISYPSLTGTADFDSVRVTKPDHRVIETPNENVLDMPSEVTRQAPFYSDLKEKHVAVKGLEVGDVVEFKYHGDIKAPLDSGHFWYDYRFVLSQVCLDEALRVSIPRDKRIILDSGENRPETTSEGELTVYAWKSSQLLTTADRKNRRANSDDGDSGSVHLTSFDSWDDLGKWERSLFDPRTVVTPAIKAKADELTHDAKTETEKIQTLFKFVSQNFRYIGISFGIGRLQPHSADDVLGNDYGDCKDKHALFTALLAAENIRAFPAFLKLQGKTDEKVPSPSQFDHVITAIPEGSGYLFLDVTPDVVPFGLLPLVERGKVAAVVLDDGTTKLVKTPQDPSFTSSFEFDSSGSLDAQGTYSGNLDLTVRGDWELLYRGAFHKASAAQWNDVMQQVARQLNFGGTVSDTKISPAGQIDGPFHAECAYIRKEYGDWPNRQIVAALPPVAFPPAPDASEAIEPLKLGALSEIKMRSKIVLPPGSHPELPASVALQTDFANYESSATFEDGTLTVVRHTVVKSHEVPAAQIEAYRTFLKKVVDDEFSFIPIGGGSAAAPVASSNAEANSHFTEGTDALNRRDLSEAEAEFQKAVEKDPKFASAWTSLATVHFYTGNVKLGLEEVEKALAFGPSQVDACKLLAANLNSFLRVDQSLKVWQAIANAVPTDSDAALHVAALLVVTNAPEEAVPVLQAALKSNPENADLYVQLGRALFFQGKSDDAIATIHRGMSKSPSLDALSKAALYLADNETALDDALQYAQKAVEAQEQKSLELTSDSTSVSDLQMTATLAAYWDALGWVYAKKHDDDQAARFLRAAAHASQDPTIFAHIIDADLNEDEDGEDSDHELPKLDRSHAIRLPKLINSDEHAQFYILFAPGPKVLGVRFAGGSEALRNATQAIQSAKFKEMFPEDGRPSKILRMGIVHCDSSKPFCELILAPALSKDAVDSMPPLMRGVLSGQSPKPD